MHAALFSRSAERMSSARNAQLSSVLVVAGPTASGKSSLALCLAEALGGVVINADSMQVYRELRVLTARPSEEDEARVPHRLYGVLPGSQRGSVAWWRDAALEEIDRALAAGQMPVLCGGTGLYLRAMIEGIADIPDVPAEIFDAARARHALLGGEHFRRELMDRDPRTANRLEPGDSQRLIRAWSVVEATGRPLSAFQEEVVSGRPDLSFRTILIDPSRDVQVDAINRRFAEMVEQGGLAEVAALRDLGLAPDLPVMKALGVPQLLDFLSGTLSLEVAVERACIATRQYAKRQRTWFRHQFLSNFRMPGKFSESDFSKMFPEIRKRVLTPAD
ncbi:MAG: tRNA (adenosine(37)-N6)-dimethylallyltransferase MiaA [Alphaproteobacteria bacterium]|nr:tRNA (adenosine(37)-N6)-dimethylallyltransferase MiaA [Alphaproteobacteria bacterium]